MGERPIVMAGLLIAGLLPSMAGAAESHHVLTGHLEVSDPGPESIKLYRAGAYVGFTFEEIAEIPIEDSRFTFQIPTTASEMLYLEPAGRAKIPIFTHGGEIEVTLRGDPLRAVEVEGSAVHQRWSEVVDRLASFDKEIAEAEKASEHELEAAQEARDAWLEKVVTESSESVLAPYLTVRHLSANMDYDELAPLVAGFSRELSEHAYVAQLKRRVEVLAGLRIGAPAPDFAAPDPEGRTIRLSDFHGKWLLVDFWASWCGPCRAQNPELIELYGALASESFEMLGVGLEFAREPWINALEKDALPWPNVSQIKGFDGDGPQRYAVRALPFNVLIDPEGRIAAKEVAPGELRATLERLR